MTFIGSLILCILFLVAGALADAIMDKLQFHFDKSIFKDFKNQQFWNPELSWQNKWKTNFMYPVTDPNRAIVGREKFWGSSRWFVGLTDGWHLIQFFQLLFYAASAAIWVPHALDANPFKVFIISLIIARIIVGVAWVLFFDKLLTRKVK